jgi:hypothetical protein
VGLIEPFTQAMHPPQGVAHLNCRGELARDGSESVTASAAAKTFSRASALLQGQRRLQVDIDETLAISGALQCLFDGRGTRRHPARSFPYCRESFLFSSMNKPSARGVHCTSHRGFLHEDRFAWPQYRVN